MKKLLTVVALIITTSTQAQTYNITITPNSGFGDYCSSYFGEHTKQCIDEERAQTQRWANEAALQQLKREGYIDDVFVAAEYSRGNKLEDIVRHASEIKAAKQRGAYICNPQGICWVK